MNWHKPACLSYAALRGYRYPALLKQYLREHERGAGYDTAKRELAALLRHCRQSVPYYAEPLRQRGDVRPEETDPVECLSRLPVLTKETIRANFAQLQSADLGRRRWSYNTSGGSTGEPVRLIQDRGYEDRIKAIALLGHWLVGADVGEPIVRLWGSERDLEPGNRSAKARFFLWLTNNTYVNAFRLTPQRLRECVDTLNRVRPALILAYAQIAYELARFVEREKLHLMPQHVIVTSAGTLYPFMREKIAQVFGCRLYNLYGSREVSLIGLEVPGVNGLWVPPWGNFVEILDDAGHPVPPGEEGNIVVTCLTNYAMPLVRYHIGDRGALAANIQPANGRPGGQVLKYVSGRSVDVFRTRDQKLVDGEYFTHLLYFRPWVGKFQVVQKAYEHVQFRIVKTNGGPTPAELDEIAAKSRLVMGDNCRVDFEFPGELPPHPAGKYRYTISEIAA
ncbi:MAG: phenylacetate--CoA ligase family protein [Verrucomicrobiota bacterium]|nr:phenylacetate--CoA ligase family protein [Verrucomicrobiota bacterium]